MDDPPGNNDGNPPAGWVRLQLEPVDVPLEVEDESLLFSTVQSAVPGAHGLYYKEEGQRKQLRYDANTNRISKGVPGWHSTPIYINLAHGCRSHTFGQYDTATKTFEKSVSAIQRMLATGDLQSCWGQGATSQHGERSVEVRRGGEMGRTREIHTSRTTKSRIEAQAEDHHEGSSDGSMESVRSSDLHKLQEENENLRHLLHDIQSSSGLLEREAREKGKALGKAHMRIDELLKKIEHGEHHQELESSITESERAEYSTTVSSTHKKTALLETDEFANMKHAKEEVERELAEERNRWKQLEADKNDIISKLEWNLGEHKQWLAEANAKISELEGEVAGQAAEFERTRNDLQAQIDRLHEKCCHQRHELHEMGTENGRLKEETEKLKTEFAQGNADVNSWITERTSLQEVIEELSRTIASKETEANGLIRELGARDALIDTLNQEKNDADWSLGEHRQWLADANITITGLKTELEEGRTGIEKTVVKLQQQSSTTTAMPEEIDHLKSQLVDQDNELSLLKTEKMERNSEIDALKSRVGEMCRALEEKNKELDDVHHLKNDAEWRLGEHVQLLSEAINRSISLEHQTESLTSEINEKNRIIDELNRLKSDEERSLEECRQWLNEANDKIKRLEAELEIFRSEHEVTVIKLQQQSQEAPISKEEIDKLRDDLIEKDQELKQLRAKEAAKNVDITSLQKERDWLKGQIASKDKRVEGLNREKNDAEWKLGEHRQWLSDANNRANGLESACIEKDATIDKLRREIEEMDTLTLDTAQEALPEEDAKVHDTITDQEKELDGMEHSLDAAFKVIDELRGEIESMKTEMNEKNGIIDDLNRIRDEKDWKLGEHQQWLEDAKNNISGMSSQIEQLSNEITEKNRIIDELKQQKADAEWSLGEHRQWLEDAENGGRSLELELDNLRGQTQEIAANLEHLAKRSTIKPEDLESLTNQLFERDTEVRYLKITKSDRDSEIGSLRAERDWLKGQISAKTKHLDELLVLKNNAESQLGEQRPLLDGANNKIGELMVLLDTKEHQIESMQNEIVELKTVKLNGSETPTADDTQQLQARVCDLERQLNEAPKQDEIDDQRSKIECLVNEINNKKHTIDELNDLKAAAEWSLGEHKHWLEEANDRITALEAESTSNNDKINELKTQLAIAGDSEQFNEVISRYELTVVQLQESLRLANEEKGAKENENDRLSAEGEKLGKEIDEKNRIIDDLNKLKSDAEWNLGEHRQWLTESNNRVEGLENACKEKETAIDSLRREIEELKTVTLQTHQGALSVQDDEVAQLKESVRNLENKAQEANRVMSETSQHASQLQAESDRLVSDINEKNRIIDDLNRIRDEKDWKLGEHRQWLEEANNRSSGLENDLKEKDHLIEELRKEIEAATATKLDIESVEEPVQAIKLQAVPEDLHLKLCDMERALADAPKPEEVSSLRSEIDRLVSEMNEKNRIIDDLNRIRDEKDWKLGEHQQWLEDAKIRADGFEHALKEKDKTIDSLTEEIEELNSMDMGEPTTGVSSEELVRWQSEVDRLVNEVNEKNGIIDDLNTIRDEKEWKLGEHRQWLEDANHRVSGLENAIKEKDGVIEDLRKEIETEATVKPDIELVEHPAEAIQVFQLQAAPEEMQQKLIDTVAEAPKPVEINVLRSEIDRLVSEINEKNRIIDDLNRIRDEKDWKLGEHQQWLEDAKNRAEGLEHALEEKDRIVYTLTEEIEELNSMDMSEPTNGVSSEELVRWQSEVDRLVGEINEKNRIIDDLNRIRDEKEWKLGEHQQWLDEANNRAIGFEMAVHEKDVVIEGLHKEFEELKHLRPGVATTMVDRDELVGLRAHFDQQTKEIKDKNGIIDDLNRIRDEMEWKLGEHLQWLSDANNKIDGLESTISGKDVELDALRREMEELRCVTVEMHATAASEEELDLARSELFRVYNEIHEKNGVIDELNLIRDQKEWSIGEHRQWLRDANNKVDGLERALRERDGVIDELRRNNREEELNGLRSEIGQLGNEMNEKNRIIDDLNGIRDTKEWQLGEQRQWLEATKNWAKGLEDACREKDGVINDLRSQLHSHPGQELENLRGEINEKNRIIDDLNRIRDEKDWKLGEHQQWLSDANNRANYLENALREKEGAMESLRIDNEDLLQRPQEERQRIREQRSASTEDLQHMLEDLHSQLDEKNSQLSTVYHEKETLDWSLGEHKTWLGDCHKKLGELDSELNGKNLEIDDLNREIREMKQMMRARLSEEEADELRERCEMMETELHEATILLKEVDRLSDVMTLTEEVGNLNSVIQDKNRIIDELNHIKSDHEWSLGEHNQWLTDANNKASWLEQVVSERDVTVEALRKEVDQLKAEQAIVMQRVVGEPESVEVIHVVETKVLGTEQSSMVTRSDEEINALKKEIDRLINEINEKNRIIDELNGLRSEAECKLGEHRQWVTDANNRGNALEVQTQNLFNEINDKNRIIDELNVIKGNAENTIRELAEAKERWDDVSKALEEKNEITEGLYREIEQLKSSQRPQKENAVREGTPQLRGMVHDLEQKLHDAESELSETLDADQIKDFFSGLRNQVDHLSNEVNEKNRIIDDLNRIREENDWSVGEHRQWLDDAKNKVSYLEDAIQHKENEINELTCRTDELEKALTDRNGLIGYLQMKIDEEGIIRVEVPQDALQDELTQAHLEMRSLESELSDAQKALSESPQAEEINGLHGEIDRLVSEIDEKNSIIDDLNRVRDEKEWNLGEHRQWLSDANNRIGCLEMTAKEKDQHIGEICKELDELKSLRVEVPESSLRSEVEQLNEKVRDLESKLKNAQRVNSEAPMTHEFEAVQRERDWLKGQITSKDKHVEGMKKEKNDAEWKLGEHLQSLTDANNRANGLESACKEKDVTIDSLRKEIDELKTVSLDATEKDAKLHDTITDQGKKIDEMEHSLDATFKVIDDLRDDTERVKGEVNEKNRIIDDLNRIRDEKEWKLGEHRQWLEDAYNRVSGLEIALKEKDDAIEELRSEIETATVTKHDIDSMEQPVEAIKLETVPEELEQKLCDLERSLAEAPKPEEITDLRGEIDHLVSEITEKNRIIDDLNRIRDEKDWKLGEHQQWLQDANNRVDDLQLEVHDRDAVIRAMREEGDLLPMTKLETSGDEDTVNKLREYVEQLESQLRNSRIELDDAPKHEKIDQLHAEIARLVNEMNDKNVVIDELSGIKDQKDWQIGEDHQSINDLNLRADSLERALREKETMMEELRKENGHLRKVSHQIAEVEERVEHVELVQHVGKAAASQGEVKNLQSEIERLGSDISEKNRIIDDLNRIRAEKEWNLGEHRQWLGDANNRADGLARAITEKDHEIESLKKEIYKMSSITVQTPDDTQQLREQIENLECKLQEAEKSMAEAVQSDVVSSMESTLSAVRSELAEKSAAVEHLSRERDDAEWRLGEHKQWLADVNKRNEELSNSLKEKDDTIMELRTTHDELKARIDELESAIKHVDASTQSSKELREGSGISVVQEMVDTLQRETTEKHDNIDRLTEERNQLEWNLGEHRQRLIDTSERVRELEQEISRLRDDFDSQLKSARTEVYELHERNIKLEESLKKTEFVVINLQREKEAKRRSLNLELPQEGFKNREELEKEFRELRDKYVELSELLKCTEELLERLQAETPDIADVNALRRTIEMLNKQMNDKNSEVAEVDQRRNDAEWHLGENRQWLADAIRRTRELEGEIGDVRKEKENVRQSLTTRIQQLEELNNGLRAMNNQQRDQLDALQLARGVGGLQTTATVLTEEKSTVGRSIEKMEGRGGDLSSLNKAIQDLRSHLNYQKVIETLTEEKNGAEQSIRDQSNLLKEAYDKINELEDLLSKSSEERDQSFEEALMKHIESTETEEEYERNYHEEETHYRRERSFATEAAPVSSGDEISHIRKELEDLREEMGKKQNELHATRKLKEEAEWCLGEHRQWLGEAKNKNSQMSGELAEKQRAIEVLNGDNQHLKDEINNLNENINSLSTAEHTDRADGGSRELTIKLQQIQSQLNNATAEIDDKDEEITNLHHVIEDLRKEMTDKMSIIDELNRIKSETECNLEEHRKWLAEANEKESRLEQGLESDRTVDSDRVSQLEKELETARSETVVGPMEVEDLKRIIGAKDKEIEFMHKKAEEAAASALTLQPDREIPPTEEELRMLQAKLRNAVEKSEMMQLQLDDAYLQIEYLKQRNDMSTFHANDEEVRGIEPSISSDDLNELSEELIRVSRNKYELQSKIKQAEMEAESCKERVLYLETETRRMGEQLWLANERVANQDRQLGEMHGKVSWLHNENDRLSVEMGQERAKFIEAGGVDYSKYEEMSRSETTLKEEKSKAEWHLGEMTQCFNDAKWRIGELEAGMAHRQWLLDQANRKVYELTSEHESLCQFRDQAKDTLNGTFLIRKQPGDGRYKWRLAMWDENSPGDLSEYRRVWFEITEPKAKRVFLSATFVNWECALLCDKFDKENGKFGVWVDIPPGRYEFLFVVDGQWKTCDAYPTVANEFGSSNNWRYID